MFTGIPGNLLEDFGECYYFNIPGNVSKDSGDAQEDSGGMLKNIPGNVSKDSRECSKRLNAL